MSVSVIMDKKVFKVGCRESELALIQTNTVIESLEKVYPKYKFEVVTMSTLGDQILDKPLPKIGEKSLFTKELETALQDCVVDLAVHSLKDLPTSLPEGLAIGAILEREDPRDAVLLKSKHRGMTLETLPEDSIIGTSSLRRIAQLKSKYPHLKVKDIRGNLQTRLRKLEQGDYDGIILATAGVKRMGWEHHISKILDNDEMLYAVGQGALAVECRKNDCKYFRPLSHTNTLLTAVAERSLLSTLEGGCSSPVAVCATNTGEEIKLTAAVWSLDGQTTLQETLACKLTNPGSEVSELPLYCGISDYGIDKEKIKCSYKLGVELAENLIKKGALKIIEESKATILNSIQ